MRVIIIKKDGIDITKELELLKKKNIQIVKDNPDFILSLGGDGTVIRSLNYALKYDVPIIPVNFGRVGYMADIESKEFEPMLDRILNNEYNISKRKLLQFNNDGEECHILNDIVFKSENVAEIDIFDDKEKITSVRGDGVIISTPTGSTAYALSSGGSILHPSLNLLNIVAIAPQYLGSRPLVLPMMSLRVISNCNIYVDGKKIGKIKELKIFPSYKELKIVEPKNKSYYSILKNKLEWR